MCSADAALGRPLGAGTIQNSRRLLDDVVLVAITRVAITQAGSDLYSLFVEPVCTKYREQA